MRSLAYVFTLASLAYLSATICLAQPQHGPATLEGLLNSEEARKPGTSIEADAGPKRPAGTAARPKDGVQYPDLDKAWGKYDGVVSEVAGEISTAINKQFDAATAKGDLDAAEKWQAALEKFEKAGELPADSETKAVVIAAVADYKKAREELTKTYEAVVKSLTMERKIAQAKAVRDELKNLARESDDIRQDTSLTDRRKTPERMVDLLAIVDPIRDSVMGRWSKQADGSVSFDQQGGPNGKLQIPFKPSAGEYKLLAEVDVLGGAGHIVMYVVINDRSHFFILKPGSVENLTYVPGARCDLERGKTHQIMIQVRNGDVSVSVDGQWVATGQAASMNDYWRLRSDGVFGIGAHESSLVFRSVRLAKP